MDHSFCVGSHLYGLFKILFNLIQCWLWVGCGLVFQMGFPYIPDNAVQIIMKNMAVLGLLPGLYHPRLSGKPRAAEFQL